MNWIDYSLAVLISLPILATIVLGAFLSKGGKHAMGKPTIYPLFFYTGKFLLFGIWALGFWICLDLVSWNLLARREVWREIPEV